MSDLLLKKCCFYVDLRLGSIILGYVDMIYCTLDFMRIVNLLYTERYTFPTDKVRKRKGLILLSVTVADLMLIIGCIAFAVALLIGLHKDRPENLKSFLFYDVFFIFGAFVLITLDLAVVEFVTNDFLTHVINLLLGLYLFVVILSYYHEIKEDDEGV